MTAPSTEHRPTGGVGPGRIPEYLPVNSPAPDAHAEGAGAFFEGGAG